MVDDITRSIKTNILLYDRANVNEGQRASRNDESLLAPMVKCIVDPIRGAKNTYARLGTFSRVQRA